MTTARESEQDYLNRLLQMNPLGCTEEILARRHHYLNSQAVEYPFLADVDLNFIDRKQRARKKLETIRRNFWQVNAQTLLTQLDKLDVHEFPELGFSVSRLQQVARLKGEFARLQQHHACFEEFYEQFTQLVVASPEEAERLRTRNGESTSIELADLDLNTPRDYQRIAEVVQKQFPELYELEKYWLNQVAVSGRERSSINRTVNVLYALIIASIGLVLLLALFYLPETLTG